MTCSPLPLFAGIMMNSSLDNYVGFEFCNVFVGLGYSSTLQCCRLSY